MVTIINLLEAMPSYNHTHILHASSKTNQAGASVHEVMMCFAGADLHDGLGGINRHQHNSESGS